MGEFSLHAKLIKSILCDQARILGYFKIVVHILNALIPSPFSFSKLLIISFFFQSGRGPLLLLQASRPSQRGPSSFPRSPSRPCHRSGTELGSQPSICIVRPGHVAFPRRRSPSLTADAGVNVDARRRGWREPSPLSLRPDLPQTPLGFLPPSISAAATSFPLCR